MHRFYLVSFIFLSFLISSCMAFRDNACCMQGAQEFILDSYATSQGLTEECSLSPVAVLGEVAFPTLLPFPTGSLPLQEALAAAGGILYTGDKCCIQVIRGSSDCPKIYRLSWNHVRCLPRDSLLLLPGDMVYVAESPLAKWSRFIKQLSPIGCP